MAYATRAQFEEYVEGWVTDDADALDRLLERSSRDVDSVLGTWSLEDNGLKFGDPQGANEKNLTPGEVIVLANATCAQAEYRVEMGDSFFVRDQYASLTGPDFTRAGKLSRIGPKVMAELGQAEIFLTRARSGFGVIRLQP